MQVNFGVSHIGRRERKLSVDKNVSFTFRTAKPIVWRVMRNVAKVRVVGQGHNGANYTPLLALPSSISLRSKEKAFGLKDRALPLNVPVLNRNSIVFR